MNCSICHSKTTCLLDEQANITYHICNKCGFISKDESCFLKGQQEKSRYDTHNNSDPSYKAFFQPLLKEFIRPLGIQSILDYGSGPYPMLSTMLEEEHYDVTKYDPFYYNDHSYQHKRYDLIVLSEVIEHLYTPRIELSKLIGLLNKDGYLLISTTFRNMDETAFLSWWYKRDDTHVGFYNLDTFHYIATLFNLSIIKHNDKNIILMQKQGD